MQKSLLSTSDAAFEPSRALEIGDVDETSRSPDILIARFLSFLRSILQPVKKGVILRLPSHLFTNLLTLLSCTTHQVFSYSLKTIDTILRLRCNNAVTITGTSPRDIDEKIWHAITELAESPNINRKISGFRVWAQWKPPQSLAKSNAFWSPMIIGLTQPSHECQKLILYILKRTLRKCDEQICCQFVQLNMDSKEETVAEYQKYVTLFETIVFERYPNQVLACLDELKRLAQQSSRVSQVWITALLTAAFGVKVQESIRKIIGNWFIHNDIGTHHNAKLQSSFWKLGFLPWATQGSLFITSIEHRQENVFCSHGELLSSLLSREIRRAEKCDDKELVIRMLLSFIAKRGDSLFPYATIYLLRGILEGINCCQCLKEEDLILLRQICGRPDMPEIARDLSSAVCSKIILEGFSTNDGTTTTNANAEFILKKAAKLRVNMLEEQSETNPLHDLDLLTTDAIFRESSSLDVVYQQLFVHRKKSLSGDELRILCDGILYVWNSPDSEISEPISIRDLISSLWNEAVFRDFPRSVLLRLPDVLLHPKCMSAFRDNGRGPLEFLQSAVLCLLSLSSGRSYCLAPLFRGLRNACIQVPHAHLVVGLPAVIVQFANDPPKPRPEFLLEHASAERLQIYFPHRHYSYYYGAREGEGYACLFDILNRHDPDDWSFAKQVIEALITPWEERQQKFRTVNKWKSTIQLQIMLLLLSKYSHHLTESSVSNYLTTFTKVLATEAIPRYRFLLEWIVCRLYMCAEIKLDTLLTDLSPENTSNPKYTASLLKIGSMLSNLPTASESFCLDIMTVMVPLCACPKIIVRHEAHWTFPTIWNIAMGKDWQRIVTNPGFRALNDHIRSLDKYKTPPPARMLEKLDLVKDHNLSTMLMGNYLYLDPPEAALVAAGDFQKIWRSDHSVDCSSLSVQLGESVAIVSSAMVQDISIKEVSSRIVAAPLQTKGSHWERSLYSADYEVRENTKIILMASLVENPHNLGGLSRCAEVFGAEKMTMRSLNPLSLRDFESVAVNSHQHLPIEPVRVHEIATYLIEQKHLGYIIVGIEQTDRSSMLGEPGTVLPEKIVLVLGSEREGIPVDVLLECDFCIEIPQVGVTRSLNVQTAASIVLYEYQRQHARGSQDKES